MEIRVLRYFLTVVREKGINRAAEVLHITQPTLSRQLAQLEEELEEELEGVAFSPRRAQNHPDERGNTAQAAGGGDTCSR